MLDLLLKHGLFAICLALFLEELAIPMPIPTDLLVIYAGYEAAGSPTQLVIWLLALTTASAAGAACLYTICRRGGRPLVDRFGRFIHFGPKQQARVEGLLNRFGWWGIVFGRSIPGLRTVTVIACGLFNVPFWRFMSAHVVGTALYVGVFMGLGATFGPTVMEYVHVPAQWVRLGAVLLLATGLPGVLAWLYYKTHARPRHEPSRRQQLTSVLLAGFFGAIACGATWTAAATVAELAGYVPNVDLTRLLMLYLEGRGIGALGATAAIYAGLLLLSVGLSALYFEYIAPKIGGAWFGTGRHVGWLLLLAAGLMLLTFVPAAAGWPRSLLAQLWRNGGTLFPLALVLGALAFAVTAAYAHALAVSVLPWIRRRVTNPQQRAVAEAATETVA